MDVHSPKNGINRYWSIPICCNHLQSSCERPFVVAQLTLLTLGGSLHESPDLQRGGAKRKKTSISLKVVNPINIWLVVHFLFFHILGIIIPTDYCKIFQRGWNHQPDITQVNRSISVINLVNVFLLLSFSFVHVRWSSANCAPTLNIEILMFGSLQSCRPSALSLRGKLGHCPKEHPAYRIYICIIHTCTCCIYVAYVVYCSVIVVTDILHRLHWLSLTIAAGCQTTGNGLRQCQRFVTGSTLNEAGWAGRFYSHKTTERQKRGEAMEKNSHGWVKLVKLREIQILIQIQRQIQNS